MERRWTGLLTVFSGTDIEFANVSQLTDSQTLSSWLEVPCQCPLHEDEGFVARISLLEGRYVISSALLTIVRSQLFAIQLLCCHFIILSVLWVCRMHIAKGENSDQRKDLIILPNSFQRAFRTVRPTKERQSAAWHYNVTACCAICVTSGLWWSM